MRFLTTTIMLIAFVFAFANSNTTQSAKKKEAKKEKVKKVKEIKNNKTATTLYLYGVSFSFNDTIVYITDVQPVEGAYLVNKKFLGDAKEYAEQMNVYFTKKLDECRTNAVYFSTTRPKAEKAYVKLRNRLNKRKVSLQPLPTGEFTFKAVRME